MIEQELIDFIRIAVTYGGGITPVKRIVDLASLHHVRTGFHGAPSHSPISMAAQAHLNAWAPNFGIQEYLVLGTPECDALFPSEHTMENGMVLVSDAPGLGVDFDEKEAKRYSYQPGSHPVVRLTAKTVRSVALPSTLISTVRLRKWMLKSATADESGKKFRSTRAIASWTNLPIDRVQYLCATHKRIFLSTGEKEDLWSIHSRSSG